MRLYASGCSMTGRVTSSNWGSTHKGVMTGLSIVLHGQHELMYFSLPAPLSYFG
jgi:hypothetical protein